MSIVLSSLWRRLKDPAIFQGNLKMQHYFEGWYYKQSDPREGEVLAVIPGVSLSEEDRHAFIQIFDGLNGKAYYLRYPIEDFKSEWNPPAIRIEDNKFSLAGVELKIKKDVSVEGSLHYKDHSLFHGGWGMRGVMGWYGYLPFMQTYHGLISMDHTVNGSLFIDGDEHAFPEARGYIEKDWGTGFPSAYVWIQANCFEEKGTSVIISIAVIHWLGSSFIGHLAIFLHNGEVINLSTYNGGKVTKLEKTPNGVNLKVETSRYSLTIEAEGSQFVDLKAPEGGVMRGRTAESLQSRIKLACYSKVEGKMLFSGESHGAGLEMMDDKDVLVRGLGLSV